MQKSQNCKMLIYIDVQTTGVESYDKLCSVGVFNEESLFYELVNEGKKIPPLASSFHHITNEMIQDKPAFQDTQIYDFLMHNNDPTNTLVAHNIKFVLQKLRASGLKWQGDTIDTCRVTKHLIKECEIFSLAFLRYELKLYKDENAMQQRYGIKDALCQYKSLENALVTKLLFAHLLEYTSVSQMKTLSCKQVLLDKFTFGKYMGKHIEEIVQNDRNYVTWMLHLEDLDEDLKYSLEYYMRG